MPRLFGRQLGRTELLRRVGRLDQVAGVRLVTLGDGAGRGVRLLEFRTGSGFGFDVVVDRAFDIGRCEMAGTPLAWIANPGTVAPWFYENDAWGWFRAWGGGMVFDMFGNYDLAWRFGVSLGIVAGLVQIVFGGPSRTGAGTRSGARAAPAAG